MDIATLNRYSDRAKDARKLELLRRINQQILYRAGWDDRASNKSCASANGAYLNGYYNQPDGPVLYYVTLEELKQL